MNDVINKNPEQVDMFTGPDIHCMIDLETLGLSHDAVMLQLGYTMFTIEDGIMFQNELTIGINDAIKHGTIDGSTLRFWMGQPDEARASVINGTVTLDRALQKFTEDVHKWCPANFWAHATFDFPILANAFKSSQGKSPINFRSCRDIRTIEMLVGNDIVWAQREGTHHTAMADAVFQTEHMIKMLRELRIRGVNI